MESTLWVLNELVHVKCFYCALHKISAQQVTAIVIITIYYHYYYYPKQQYNCFSMPNNNLINMASFQNSNLWIFKLIFSIWLTKSSNTYMAISLFNLLFNYSNHHLPISRKSNISFLRFLLPRIASEPWGLPQRARKAGEALILTTSCSVTCTRNTTENVPQSSPQELCPDLGTAFTVPCFWTPVFMLFSFYQNLHTGSPWSHPAFLTHRLG